MTITSVFTDRSSAPVIEAIFALHFPDTKRVLDMTYGKGVFWKWDYQFELLGVDVAHAEGGLQADSRHLTMLDDNTFDVAVIDPPFMHGASPGGYSGGVKLDDYYSRLPSQHDVLSLYEALANEAHRLVTQGMIIKCKDIIESGKYIPMEQWLITDLDDNRDWRLIDKAVYVPPMTLAKDPRWGKQKHFRRQESYFLVFKRGN